MKHRTLRDFWETHRHTRAGQCYGLLVFGFIIGLAGASNTKDAAVLQRTFYGIGAGVALGILLILVMVVPSIYLAFIRRKRAAGGGVLVHQVLLGLYFFPFLTFATIGSVAFVLNYFGS